MFGWARRLLERFDPDRWAEDRATAMAFTLPPVANIPKPREVTRSTELSPEVKRLIAEMSRDHRGRGADIDRRGSSARKPKSRKRKTAKKSKRRKAA